MHDLSKAAVPGGGKRPSLPRWYRLLYLLAAFALFSTALSLYLSHQYLGIAVRSVAVSRARDERLRECARLGQLAAGVNAPGNDIFQSQRVDAEERKNAGGTAAVRRTATVCVRELPDATCFFFHTFPDSFAPVSSAKIC